MSLTTGITAYSGGGAGSAVLLNAQNNVIATSAAHLDSVILDNTISGDITVRNDGANDVGIYPHTGGNIDGLGANVVYPLASGSVQIFRHLGGTIWTRLNRSIRYVDRGDPAAYDFDQASLDDTSYADLDLSSLCPPSSAGLQVHLKTVGTPGTPARTLRFRGNGNSNDINRSYMKVTAGTTDGNDVFVPLDADRVIEYYVDAEWDSLGVVVSGWYVEG